MNNEPTNLPTKQPISQLITPTPNYLLPRVGEGFGRRGAAARVLAHEFLHEVLGLVGNRAPLLVGKHKLAAHDLRGERGT